MSSGTRTIRPHDDCMVVAPLCTSTAQCMLVMRDRQVSDMRPSHSRTYAWARVSATSSQQRGARAPGRTLLGRARERTGASVERMVKTFGELQPRGAVTRRSWYDWQERPETVSLLTGLAAMHALGREASMELVFGEAAGVGAGVDAATKDARIDQLQSTVEDAMTSSCSCASASRASSSPSSSAKASRSRPSWPI